MGRSWTLLALAAACMPAATVGQIGVATFKEGTIVFEVGKPAESQLKLPVGQYDVVVHTAGDVRPGGSGIEFTGPALVGQEKLGQLTSQDPEQHATGTLLTAPLTGAASVLGRAVAILPSVVVVKGNRFKSCPGPLVVKVDGAEQTVPEGQLAFELRFPITLQPNSIGASAVTQPQSVAISVGGGFCVDDLCSCPVTVGTVNSPTSTEVLPTVYVSEGFIAIEPGGACLMDKPDQCSSGVCVERKCTDREPAEHYTQFGYNYAMKNMGLLQPVTDGQYGNVDGVHEELVNGVWETIPHGDYKFTPIDLGNKMVEVMVSSRSFKAVAVAVVGLSMPASGPLATPPPGQSKVICEFDRYAAVSDPSSGAGAQHGSVLITKHSGEAVVQATISGLGPGSKSFHFHAFGDLRMAQRGVGWPQNLGPPYYGAGKNVNLPLLEVPALGVHKAFYAGKFAIGAIDEFVGRSITVHGGPELSDPTVAWAVCGLADPMACLEQGCLNPVDLEADRLASIARDPEGGLLPGWLLLALLLALIIVAVGAVTFGGFMYCDKAGLEYCEGLRAVLYDDGSVDVDEDFEDFNDTVFTSKDDDDDEEEGAGGKLMGGSGGTPPAPPVPSRQSKAAVVDAPAEEDVGDDFEEVSPDAVATGVAVPLDPNV